MDDYTPSEQRGYRRVTIAAILLLLALGLLPATGAILDTGEEALILPVFVTVMIIAGALLWSFVPLVVEGPGRTGRRVAFGAGTGLLAAAAAIFVFYALLNGFSGS